MIARAGRLRSLAVTASVGIAGLGAAGNSAAQSGTILGRVVDTTGLVLPQAEVSLVGAETGAVFLTASSDGEGRFVLREVPAGQVYDLLARKLGYSPAQHPGVQFQGGDTLRITFRLPPATTVLPELQARAPLSRRRITASEFDPGGARDALRVLGRYRPDMLGDPAVCPDLPPQPLWRQQEIATQTTGRGSGAENRASDRSPRRPWLDSLSNVGTDPYSPYVLRVYVNGIRRDHEGRSPLATLRGIPSEQIAEMYYADCHDDSVPLDMRYSVYVVLKPLPLAEQQRVLRRIIPDSTAAADSTQ
jgi:Carboxypeptidase regulatory-like domain